MSNLFRPESPGRRIGAVAGSIAVTAFFLVGITSSGLAAASRPDAVEAGAPIQPSGTVEPMGPPVERLTPDEGAAAAAAPVADAPFRPTMDAVEYKKAKAQANASKATARPGATAAAPEPTHPPGAAFKNFEGLNQSESGGLRPPDNDGAHGGCQYAQVVNSALRVWNTCVSPPAITSTKSLATFFGYTLQTIFDPRIIYDDRWDRWVVLAEAFPESDSVQRVFLSASKTSDANGSYWHYQFDLGGGGAGEVFWDYAQLGNDQDAVLITANIFPNAGGFRGADFLCYAKAGLYNGGPISSPRFTALDATLAPPNVLDNSSRTFLVAAPNGSGTLSLYRASNCGRSGTSIVKQATIAVPGGYTLPPDADQPGTADDLDTIDNRFVNRSTQYGTSVWNVHTVNDAGFPTPKFYEINTSTNALKQTGSFFKSGSSDDWMASIAVRTNGTACVTWSATDASLGTNAQVRYSCRHSTDALGSMNSPGVALFTSPTFYNPSTSTVERWGDYSAVALDTTSSRFYIVNEKINSATVWGSRIAQIGY